MYHYYLTPPTTQSTDTIYVVDAHNDSLATWLKSRLGCERISRQTAIDVDRTHRHTGRGTAWAQSVEVVHQIEAQGYDDHVMLKAAIDDAADATLESCDFYREMDAEL